MSNENGKVLRLKVSRAPDGRARIVALIDGREIAVDVCDLFSDADRDRVAKVIHNACPALTVKSIQRELLIIDRENLPDADDGWDDPIDLERPDLPGFPVDALPGVLGDWVRAVANAYQVPAELAGLLALAACSGIVARRVEIAPGEDWIEPVNLYVAALLDPGSRKSAVFREALKPIRDIERERIEAEGPEIARMQSERRCRELQLKDLERKGSKDNPEAFQAMADARELSAALDAEPIPSLPKMVMDDATPEAIEMQLAAQDGRIIVAGAEGGLFDIMGGRYSGGSSNLDVFLKGHAGDDLRVDRVIRGGLYVPRCCLTLAYAVQPEVIRGLAGKPSFRGRGLIGRFLYGLPKSNLGNRRINPEPIPEGVVAAYLQLIQRLAKIDVDENGLPRCLRFSRLAKERFDAWQAEVETMLADNGLLSDLRDWGGKLCGLTARLAAVIHLVTTEDTEPWQEQLSVDAIDAAVKLSRWAIPHAQAAIGLMAADDGRLDDAAYCLRFIRSKAEPQVSRRDIHTHGRARFDRDPERLDRALDVLLDRGWLRPAESEQRAGRPSVLFDVHPKAIERLKGVI